MRAKLNLASVVVAGVLLLQISSASALSKNTYSTSFSGEGATALTNPTAVAVDSSTGDVYVANSPINERQTITITATGGTYTLSFKGQTTFPIHFNESAVEVREALESLPAIRPTGQSAALHNVSVTTQSAGEVGEITVEFTDLLGRVAQPLIAADGSHLTGTTHTVTVATTRPASSVADVEKFSPNGEFILIFGKEVDRTQVEAHAPEAQQNLCTAESGDVCQPGSLGTSPGSFTDPAYLAIDASGGPSSGDLYVGDRVFGEGSGDVQKFGPAGDLIASWGKDGLLDGTNVPDGQTFSGNENETEPERSGLTGLAVDPAGRLFVRASGRDFEFAPDGSPIADFEAESPAERTAIAPETADVLYVASLLDHSAIDPATLDRFLPAEGGVQHLPASCDFLEAPCTPADTFGSGQLTEPGGIAFDNATGALYVADTGDRRVAVFSAEPYLPDAVSPSAKPLTPTSEALEGTADPATAAPITACHFDYGANPGGYGLGSASCEASPPSSLPYSSPTQVAATVTHGLTYGTTYHYHLFLENASGANSSYDQEFTTLPEPPQVEAEAATAVHADFARLGARINPGGGEAIYHTAYHVEYVTRSHFEEEEGFEGAEQSPSADAGSARTFQPVIARLPGLKPDTTYLYRFVAENASSPPGGALGPVRSFTTLPFFENIQDECPNAHARQQTSAALLLDCRAYELVSAAHAGGYDVESSLVPGQTPFADYPEAEGRVLYGVHGGGIPGTGEPTNRGVDPYIATRGPEGWSTKYVGIPANGTPSTSPFSSTLLEADAGLGTFAFGGPEICSPCFEDHSTGIPIHRPNGELVQGMVGSLIPGSAAKSEGFIAKHLSADGSHLLFGSKSQFEPDGNEGEVSIYDRNLETGETHVVSKTPGPNGQTMREEGKGIGELDVSKNGSRIVIGHLVEEKEGAKYWHLYMNIGDSGETIDLTPGTAHGVLFDGMTADGSKVFFTTTDPLTTATNQDTDHSADIYLAEVNGAGAMTLTRISTGTAGTGNTDACDPVENSAHQHWNTTASEANCGVVAIGGGGGLASKDGTVYFLSPELLAGTAEPADGTKNAPNLYVARPGDGYAPHFIATLESVLTAPHPPKLRPVFDHEFGSFAHATALGVDHAAGDVYAFDAGAPQAEPPVAPSVSKFDSKGNPVDFAKGPGAGTNRLTGPNATGTGTLESGSTTITAVATESGAFSVGETIEAAGLPAETTITAVGSGTLEVSQAATESGAQSLSAGQRFSASAFGLAFIGNLAVDSSGNLYVPDVEHNAVDKFSSAGEYLGQISGLSFPTAVAIDPANGDLFIAGLLGEVSIYDSSGSFLSSFATQSDPEAPYLQSIAVDSNETVYVTHLAFLTNAQTEAYESSGKRLRMLDSNPGQSVTVDPSTNDVYVDEGSQIERFDSSGKQLETIGPNPPGPSYLSGSYGVAIDPEGSLYATNEGGSRVAVFKAHLAADQRVDNPAVVDSVSEPEARHTAEFQTTADGNFAVFPSTLALAGGEEETAGHAEVFRYDAAGEALACASCTPTGIPSASEASLAKNGLSVAGEGAVFFTTTDQLSAADTDEKPDVYEWEPKGTGSCAESSPTYSRLSGACTALISSGTSAFDSALLGISSAGTDAYFFTRDSLAPGDENGPTAKIYDARVEGGFPFTPTPADCKASDECHGGSTPPPPPLQVGSESGTPHNFSQERCPKGFVRRHGHCVKKHRRARHHRRAGRKRGARR